MPDNPICLQLVTGLGNPILSASAKTPDGTSFHEPSLMDDYYGQQLDAVIDGGPVPSRPSSVISLIDDEPEVLREGLGDVEIFA